LHIDDLCLNDEGGEMLTGGCLCGKVRYEVTGAPFHSTICHCVDCRRCAAAPLVAWFSVKRSEFRVTRGTLARFASSKPVLRTFCPDCGTPLTYQHDDFPDEIDVTTCSLDAPNAVAPNDHTWASQRLPWLPISDGLPQYPRGRDKAHA
jgi:hypothetical protein